MPYSLLCRFLMPPEIKVAILFETCLRERSYKVICILGRCVYKISRYGFFVALLDVHIQICQTTYGVWDIIL